MHEYKSIRYEIDGHLVRLTLNRTELLNAIDDEMHNDLLSVLLEIRGEPEIRAVLFGAEGKAFSAGGDLNEVASLQADIAKRTRMCETGLRIIHALLDIPVPIVVALHGDAMGLGASIVLGCDIIVASRTARIADPHVKVGLVPRDQPDLDVRVSDARGPARADHVATPHAGGPQSHRVAVPVDHDGRPAVDRSVAGS